MCLSKCQPPFPVVHLPKKLRDGMEDLIPAIEGHERPRKAHSAELYGGEHAITSAFVDWDMLAYAFDKIYHRNQDVLSPKGFQIGFDMLMDVVPSGLAFAAPECKTWIWVARNSTGRSKEPIPKNPAPPSFAYCTPAERSEYRWLRDKLPYRCDARWREAAPSSGFCYFVNSWTVNSV